MNHLNSTVVNRMGTYTYGIQNVHTWLFLRKGHCREAGNYTCESSLGDYVARAHVEVKCKYNARSISSCTLKLIYVS